MKNYIKGIEKEWLAALFGVIGILLIIFPDTFTVAIPYMLGAGLLVHGVVSLIAFLKYKEESKVHIGSVIIYAVLGAAILYQEADAIGAIGGIWAMIALMEAGEELNEMFHEKKCPIIQLVSIIISVGLAVVLLFDPVEHFTFHVRILGLEMLSSLFVRGIRLFRLKRGTA